MSQFDQLLDFGEPVTPETNGTSPKTGAADDFDPFGPSPTIEGKGTSDSNLLVDFTIDSEVSNGKPENGTADSFNMNFEVSTSASSNPLYEMSSDSKAVFIEDGDSTNPLYEFTTKTETSSTLDSSYDELHPQENTSQDTSNPLYEFSNNDENAIITTTTTTTSASSSANPLYDLMGNGDEHHFDESNTVVTKTEKVTQDGDFIVTERTTVVETTPEREQKEVTPNSEDDFVHINYDEGKTEGHEYEDMTGGHHDVEIRIQAEPVEEQENADVTQQQDRFERSRSPSRSCSPSHSVDHTKSPSVTDEEEVQRFDQEMVEQQQQHTEEVEQQQKYTEEVEQQQKYTEEVEQQQKYTEEVEQQQQYTEEVEQQQKYTEEVEQQQQYTEEVEQQQKYTEEVEEQQQYTEEVEEQQQKHYEEVEEYQQHAEEEDQPEVVLEKHEEVVEQHNEEEEVIQDGQTVFRAKDEKRYSDSFTDRSDHDVKQDFSTPHYLANEQMQQKGVGQYNQNFAGETVSREEVHVSEMNTFETEQEEGVYENEPQKRSDVVRESDRNIAEGLPEIGMAKNLLNKFAHITDQPAEPKRKELTPPDSIDGPVEYVSEPRSTMEMYQGRPEAGVFENQPAYNPDIMRSGGAPEDILPERGMARNVASKFKELEKSGSSGSHTSGKREITPDREGGKVEFVSEPRGYVEKYEGRAESGVFENEPGHIDNVVKSGEQIEEELPERGYAKNIASKFKQLESGTAPSPDKGRKKEMTPDRSTKVEYVSEPRGYVETYEGKAEAGVFENQPYSPTTEVIKCDQPISDEPLPEKGYAQHIAAKFREMESSAKSPPPTPVRIKEITPPRDDGNVSQNSGVFESQPQVLPDVVRSEDNTDDIVPQTGYAKSLVSRFKQLEAESSKTVTSSKQKREITPPKGGSGVFENQPKQFIPEYNRQAESGILENNPEHIEGVIKESDPPKFEEELPERGMAKNLVSRWKQMENHGSTQSATAKQRIKEFTPPREEERVKAARSPRSPSGGQSQSFQQENLPNQAGEPSVFESEPGIRDDVFREADTDWMEGMPKSNTTKKMLEKFKHIQEEAKKQPPKPVPKSEEQGDSSRESPSRNETKVCSRKASYRDTVDHSEVPAVRSENIADAKKSGGYMVAVQAEKCGVCGKSVYAMERLEMNKVVYHKTCFKCSQCKATLTPKTFAVNNGIMFCTNHYKQLFARKGNYDEGFGREQHKKKWRSEPSLTDSEQEAT
ncbi:involucrin-like isoform X9 [Gigantopelta aegis]|uniref:involucrin-like isoform X9 n=1 Tax=Gigantopelta aegis TaxID=1735272 RepID=UPI001B88E05D|nr:involucrin-like isoform X9 [Gigantopelta aegis]